MHRMQKAAKHQPCRFQFIAAYRLITSFRLRVLRELPAPEPGYP